MTGIFGNILHNDVKVFRELLYSSTLRGPHSTGIGLIKKSQNDDDKTRILKDAVPAGPFLVRPHIREILDKGQQYEVMIGHNRYATIGNITPQNAHPFRQGAIMLAHNGGVNNHRTLSGQNFEVDSEHIAFLINRDGIDETLEKLSGAFCLTFFDENTNKFHIIRNDQRPLYIAKNKSRAMWYYGSEQKMVEWILSRNNVEIDQEHSFSLPVGKLLTYDLNAEWNKRDITLEDKKLYVPKTYTHQRSNQHYGDYIGGSDDNDFFTPRWAESSYPKSSGGSYKSSSSNNVTKIEDFRKSEINKASSFGVSEGDRVLVYLYEWKKYPLTQGIFTRRYGECEGIAYEKFTEEDVKVGLDVRGLVMLDFDVIVNGVQFEDVHYFDESEQSEEIEDKYKFKEGFYTVQISRFRKVPLGGTFDWQLMCRDPKYVEFADAYKHRQFISESSSKALVKVTVPEVSCVLCKKTIDKEELVYAATLGSSDSSADQKVCIDCQGDIENLDNDEEDELDVEIIITGPYGREITEEEWDDLTKHGCSNCSCELDISDHKEVAWIGDNPLCFLCDQEMQELYRDSSPIRKESNSNFM